MCISSIPPRGKMLRRALASVLSQTLLPEAIIVEIDHERTGSAFTKNRAMAKARTEWIAVLDDDDQFLANHLERLREAAEISGADVVYSLPRVLNAHGDEIPRQPDWGGGAVFNPELLRRKAYIQTTCLVKAEWAIDVGGFEFVKDDTGAVNDDHGFFLKLLNAGARFAHVHEQTFIWNHHGVGAPGVSGNTSGQPDRW